MHRAAPDSMLARTNNVRLLRARKAIAHAVIVRTTARHVARMPVPVATVRKAITPAAIVRSISIAAPAAHRRTHARMARVRIDPTMLRVARVTKGCRATRIEAARSKPASVAGRREYDGKKRTAPQKAVVCVSES
jgi:hypothetical protein